MKLPLPPDYFNCPPLSHSKSTVLALQAHALAMAWAWSASTVAKSRQTNPNIKLYVGVAEVAGTIDESVELFRFDTTERAKAYVARIGKGLLDSANLYTLAEPSVDRPHDSVAINWTALQSPASLSGWVVALKSIDVACCPDMQQSHGLIRMHQLGSGHVFLESDRKGYLRIVYNVHSVFNIILDLATFWHENRLAKGTFLLGDELVPKDWRHACQLCHKMFGIQDPLLQMRRRVLLGGRPRVHPIGLIKDKDGVHTVRCHHAIMSPLQHLGTLKASDPSRRGRHHRVPPGWPNRQSPPHQMTQGKAGFD
ncbi:Aste57867_914 [Aphanomyces stellatus]|uniref:Aste57867_914 protein n=1 Tax=Aphanomyces stellatus TaxID=120398 RepID=A0A485K6H9_9STRA|nr:hypothetical protein As57867_000913 [Aphanomyces stellatus]VFT78138.1 Aste57867_914 [Aphanomyces stellatus]